MRALIIGYGNPLRGDDGIGWEAAKLLGQELDQTNLQILASHQLMPELAPAVGAADLVIFIDATYGTPPGATSCTHVPCEPTDRISLAHQLTPGQVLGYAKQLTKRCPAAYVITIVGDDFGFKEDLTPPVRRACEKLPALVYDLLVREGVEMKPYDKSREAERYGYA